MPLSSPLSIPLQEELMNDCKSVLRKLNNMKNVAARSNFHMDSKLMILKLRRARLGSQLAYSQDQSVLAEMELQLAEMDLKHELIRRRQFVTRSRAIRQTMKPHTDVTSKKIQTTQIYKDEKNTVDRGTQVDKDIDDEIEKNLEKKIKVARRKSRSSSKKKLYSDKDSLSKDRTKTSRVGTDETPYKDRSRSTTGKEETEISNPSKKQKTDVKSHSADKDKKTNRDSREKRKEKRDSKKSGKDKSYRTEKNKKSDTSNIQELNNDRPKNRDSETDAKHAKNRHDAKVKKPTKSDSKNPTDKEISKNNNFSFRDQASNDNTSERFIEPNVSCDVDKTQNTEANNVCEASEENSDKDIGSSTANEAVQLSNGKCDTSSCNRDKPEFTVVIEVADRKVIHRIIEEMCEVPKKDVHDNIFEGLGVVKRERSNSISSVETLKLQDESN